MEADKFAAVLRSKLREKMNDLSDQVVNMPMTLEEYRRAQGMITGLAIAERELLDLASQADLDDAISGD